MRKVGMDLIPSRVAPQVYISDLPVPAFHAGTGFFCISQSQVTMQTASSLARMYRHLRRHAKSNASTKCGSVRCRLAGRKLRSSEAMRWTYTKKLKSVSSGDTAKPCDGLIQKTLRSVSSGDAAKPCDAAVPCGRHFKRY